MPPRAPDRKQRLERANNGVRPLEPRWGYAKYGATVWEDALQGHALGLTRWWLARKAELKSQQLLRFVEWAAEQLARGGGQVQNGAGAPAAAHAPPVAALCTICLNATSDTACVPCGHQALCHTCAAIVLARGDRCPICRAQVVNTLRIFL